MSELAQYLLEVIIVLLFAAITVWCIVLAGLRKYEFMLQEKLWFKVQWWYGVTASILFVSSVWVGFIVWFVINILMNR